MKSKKMKKAAFGKDIYFLGSDAAGVNYWLERASWDCGWYWGFGYVETYTNNANPAGSRDVASHQHFDGLFLKNAGYVDGFRALLPGTPLSDAEIWQLLELMKTFYILREYADTLERGGAHITSNPAANVIKSPEERERINAEVLPAIFAEVYKLLTPEE